MRGTTLMSWWLGSSKDGNDRNNGVLILKRFRHCKSISAQNKLLSVGEYVLTVIATADLAMHGAKRVTSEGALAQLFWSK